MYGIPENLNLTFLLGAEVVQISLGSFDVQIHFHPEASIAINGSGWQLRDTEGKIIDQASQEPACDRTPFLLHRLLGRRVQAIQLSPPEWVEVQFEGGLVLRIIDDSEQYESFEIWPPGLIV